jgi:hypothetical protein
VVGGYFRGAPGTRAAARFRRSARTSDGGASEAGCHPVAWTALGAGNIARAIDGALGEVVGASYDTGADVTESLPCALVRASTEPDQVTEDGGHEGGLASLGVHDHQPAATDVGL